MNYLRFHQLTEPGHYWFLPKHHEDAPYQEANWEMVFWNQAMPERLGVYQGPLEPPLYKIIAVGGVHVDTHA